MPKIDAPGNPTSPPLKGQLPQGPAIAISIKTGDTKWGDHVTVWVTGDGKLDGDASPSKTCKVHVVAGDDFTTCLTRPLIGKMPDPVAPKTERYGIEVKIEEAQGTKWPDISGPVKHWDVEDRHIHALLKEAYRIRGENESNPWVYGTAITGRVMNCASFAERVLRAAGITYVSAGIIIKTPSELLGAGKGGQLRSDESSRWNTTTGKYDR